MLFLSNPRSLNQNDITALFQINKVRDEADPVPEAGLAAQGDDRHQVGVGVDGLGILYVYILL